MIRKENQKRLEELDERVKQSLQDAEDKRLLLLTEIKEKCCKHVEEAKRRAAIAEEKKQTSENTPA